MKIGRSETENMKSRPLFPTQALSWSGEGYDLSPFPHEKGHP